MHHTNLEQIHFEDQGAESRREGPERQITFEHSHPGRLVGLRTSQVDRYLNTRQPGNIRCMEEGPDGQESS